MNYHWHKSVLICSCQIRISRPHTGLESLSSMYMNLAWHVVSFDVDPQHLRILFTLRTRITSNSFKYVVYNKPLSSSSSNVHTNRSTWSVILLPALTETDFGNILDSLLSDGTLIASLNTKWFRETQLSHLSTLPTSYLRASPLAWHRFWKASFPHRAHTLLWWLYHHKMPCKECLHQLIPNRFPDPGCVYCGGIDSEEHFVWSCPFKHEIWQTIASRFSVDPARLTYSLIQLPFFLWLWSRSFTFGDLLGYHSFYAALFMATSLEIYFWRASILASRSSSKSH